MPARKDLLSLAKIKINNFCQEINQEVYKLMIDTLQRMDPGEFLEAKFNFYFTQEPESVDTHSTESDAGTEERYSGLHVKFSGTAEITNSENEMIFRPQQDEQRETSSEGFSGSQRACSSRSSSDSLIRSYPAPVAPIGSCSRVGVHESSPGRFTLPEISLDRIDPRLKRTHSHAFSKNRKSKRFSGKYDPENHEIMRLRQEENLDFQEIADRLNKVRSQNGSKDDLTDNAIYSRYTRNAPLIAQLRNEKFVPTAKDNQYTKMKFPRVEPISGFNPEEDALLELAEQQIEEQFWYLVSQRIEELGGGSHDAGMCERRFECL